MKVFLIWGKAQDFDEDSESDLWDSNRASVVVASTENEALDLVFERGNFLVPRLAANVREVNLDESQILLSTQFDISNEVIK